MIDTEIPKAPIDHHRHDDHISRAPKIHTPIDHRYDHISRGPSDIISPDYYYFYFYFYYAAGCVHTWARSVRLVPARELDQVDRVAAADRAREMREEPHVDALGVEAVVAIGEEADRLLLFELHEANRALVRLQEQDLMMMILMLMMVMVSKKGP